MLSLFGSCTLGAPLVQLMIMYFLVFCGNKIFIFLIKRKKRTLRNASNVFVARTVTKLINGLY